MLIPITSGGANPAGSGSELQYRAGASTFGAVTGSSVSGAKILLSSGAYGDVGILTLNARSIDLMTVDDGGTYVQVNSLRSSNMIFTATSTFSAATTYFGAAATPATLQAVSPASGAGNNLTLAASAAVSGNTNGGNGYLIPGAKAGSGIDGCWAFKYPTSSPGTNAHLTEWRYSDDTVFAFISAVGGVQTFTIGLDSENANLTFRSKGNASGDGPVMNWYRGGSWKWQYGVDGNSTTGANSFWWYNITNSKYCLGLSEAGKLRVDGTGANTALQLLGIPTSAAGLSTGDVWCDTSGGFNILKIV